MEVVTEEATVEAMEVEDGVRVDRPVTRAEAMDTCLETALKARNATIVWSPFLKPSLSEPAKRTPGGEVGHLSRDCPSEPSSERVCYKVCPGSSHCNSCTAGLRNPTPSVP